MKTYPQIVTAVIVTHNRIEELEKAVRAVLHQTIAVQRIIIVDNASLPAVKKYNSTKVRVIRLESNQGGAGGFALGISAALMEPTDWIWLMDDDAIPRNDSLERLLEKLSLIELKNNPIGFVCSAVYENGRVARMHRRKFCQYSLLESPIKETQYQKNQIRVDSASFNGFLIKSDIVDVVGLPNHEYFLSYDDTEYSLRIAKAGYSNWLIPSSKIDHLRENSSKMLNSPFGLKHYYNIRNRFIFYKKFAYWKTLATYSAIFYGIAIWIACKDSSKMQSVSLLLRAIKDGAKGRLGQLDLKATRL